MKNMNKFALILSVVALAVSVVVFACVPKTDIKAPIGSKEIKPEIKPDISGSGNLVVSVIAGGWGFTGVLGMIAVRWGLTHRRSLKGVVQAVEESSKSKGPVRTALASLNDRNLNRLKQKEIDNV